MASQTSSTLTRYRPAILILTALATGCTIYYIHNNARSSTQRSSRLRRSNAVHRQRGRPNRPNGTATTPNPHSDETSPDLRFLDEQELLQIYQDSPMNFGTFTTSIGEVEFRAPLTRGKFPSLDFLKENYSCSQEEAEHVRQDFEEKLLQAFLSGRLPSHSVLPRAEDMFPLLEGEGFMFLVSISTIFARWNTEALTDAPGRLTISEVQMTAQTPRPRSRPVVRVENTETDQANEMLDSGSPDVVNFDNGAAVRDIPDTTVDEDSEHSWRTGDENEDESRKEGQNLLNMLYHIAEDQSRREGYVHRGVSCNSCNAHPIRGIRYRCANCVDYDLCEQCEAMQMHPKTHLFYKIRIPAPHLGNPRRPQPVWYPGKPAGLPIHLNREFSMDLSKVSGFETSEIDALWDQFKCLAAVEWPEDPHPFGMAIDRDTFDRCFMPTTSSIRTPPTLLIYDRMFSFYDTNHDGLIGFEEFVVGLSAMRSKNKDARNERIFHGYDHDGDGYVDRKDCLLMFRAFYTLTRELTRDMVAGMEEDLLEGGNLRENVTGTQPISSVYTGSIPVAERSHGVEGKRENEFGDMIVFDNRGVILDNNLEEGDQQDVIGDLSEVAVFGSLSDHEHIGRNNKTDRDSNVDHHTNDSASSSSDSLVEGIFPFGPEVGQWEVLPDHDAIGIPGEPSSTTPLANVDDHWPPSHVSRVDVDSALHEPVPLREISSPSDRRRVLQAAQRRIGIEERRREARQVGLQQRVDRRQFYLDEDQEQASPTDSNKPETNMGNGHPIAPRLDGSVNKDDSTQMPGRIVPPLDEDVGREILYQITQEGLNELLDPLFKCREDLAIEVMRTKTRRKELKKDLVDFQSEGMKKVFRFQVRRFQQRWRLDSTTPACDFGEKLREHVEKQEDKKGMAYADYLCDMRRVGMLEDDDYAEEMVEILNARQEDPDRAILREMDEESKRGAEFSRRSLALESSPQPKDILPEETASVVGGAPSKDEHPDEYPSAAIELQEAMRVFDEATSKVEEIIKETELGDLLESAGYGITKAAEKDEEPKATEAEASVETIDPTMPQNRPNTAFESKASTHSSEDVKEADSQVKNSSHSPNGKSSEALTPTRQELKYLAMLNIIEEEDNEQRGGPGRLGLPEFDEMLRGPQGSKLGFLGSWIELVNF